MILLHYVVLISVNPKAIALTQSIFIEYFNTVLIVLSTKNI